MRLASPIPVLQHFPNRGLPDVAGAVRAELAAVDAGAGFAPGARIAIGAGSRGISNLATIVRSTVDHFRERGFQPFVVPAMGSHGGGTDLGQLDVLAHYGVTEVAMGCPIKSCVDAAPFGTTPDGIETYFDRNALQSDGVFVVNRVKWHTTFDAPIESGLLKMASIGLGKLQGATNYHRHGVRLGLGAVIRSVGRHVLASGKVIGGLAIVEDAHHATAKVAALSAVRMEEEEEKLLMIARSWMARLLFDDIDILIVDEVGKHISGVGMDSKVVNRHPYGTVNPWPWAPRIRRIYVRDLSALSYGNAVGVGLADVISDRFYEKIDWKATKVNAMASSNILTIKTPIRAATDREALEILAAVVGRADPSEVTFAWIRNTLELSHIAISENLLGSASPAGDVEVTGPAFEWPFDAAGNLASEASAVTAG
ncbi:MAG: hypothetical protein ACR2I2_12930 [Bryobacteraceae bacterium]